MKEVKTLKNFEVVFVLDRSGSMGGKDKYGVKEFDSVLASVKCLREH